MPANLTPQYLAAEQRFKEAKTLQEKVERLEEMLATIPKHKGTEKLQGDLKRRLAKLREESDKKHGSSKGAYLYTVPREGAGQVLLVGAPNTGKSRLLSRLTKAAPEIADYPFTTQRPQPGMMHFEDIQIQLVDMPPVAAENYEPWMGGIIRQSDLVLLVVDLGSAEVLDEIEEVTKTLEGSRIRLVSAESERDDDTSAAALQTILVANKSDQPLASENLPILQEFFGALFEIHAVSAETGSGLEPLRRIVFQKLRVIRVYTKAPGKKLDQDSTPFVLKEGSTVIDAARAVHRDFAQTLKFARLWSPERPGRKTEYIGQMVDRNHALEDGDILELHV
jgi:ribosome-interacting GTPase 1